MIIIIRALSHEEIKKERESPNKKREGLEKEKMREKERRDNVTIRLQHLCFKVAP